MADANEDIPEWPIERPRYFDNLFLQSQDFVDEQHFHLGMRRRADKLLRVSGVAQGLGVTGDPADDWKIVIGAGTAIDGQGRMILLPSDSAGNLRGASGTQYVYIAFAEEATGKSALTSEGKGTEGKNRLTQKPQILIRADPNSPPEDSILLASVPMTTSGVNKAQIDDLRRPSGLRLPIPADAQSFGYLTADNDTRALLCAGPGGVSLGYSGTAANATSVTRVMTISSSGVSIAGGLGLVVGGPLTANGGISVPDGKNVVLGSSGLTLSGSLRANGGISVPDGKSVTIGNGGLTIGGVITANALTTSGPLKANGGLTIPQGQSLGVGSAFGATISGGGAGGAFFGSNLLTKSGGDYYTPYDHGNGYGYSGVVASWGKLLFITGAGNTTAGTQITPAPRLIVDEKGAVTVIGAMTTNALSVLGPLTANAGLTLKRDVVRLGTTDGSTAARNEVVGGIGFLGSGVQHGQLSFRAGSGFELVDCSVGGPRVGYNVGELPYANLTVAAITSNGSRATLLNDSNPIRFSSAWSSFPDESGKNNQAEISNDVAAWKTLMIVGNRSADGKERRVDVWDHLHVHGNVTLGTDNGIIRIASNRTYGFMQLHDDLWFHDPQNGEIEIRKNDAANSAWATMRGQFVPPSSRDEKKDIASLSSADHERLLDDACRTDVVTFRYRADESTHRPRLGVIIEDCPPYLQSDSGKGLSTPEYIAMIHGALKAVVGRVAQLEKLCLATAPR